MCGRVDVASGAAGAAAGRGPETADGGGTGAPVSSALAFAAIPAMVSTVAATLVAATAMRAAAAGWCRRLRLLLAAVFGPDSVLCSTVIRSLCGPRPRHLLPTSDAYLPTACDPANTQGSFFT